MALEEPVLQELVALSRRLGEPARDLAILGEGNTSARIDDAAFYVKASGRTLDGIGPSGFCRVRFDRVLPALETANLDDAAVRELLLNCVESGEREVLPSVETFLHAYLLTLPDARFIGHTHPVPVNSLLCSGRAREAFAGALFPDQVVCCGAATCFIEYVDPGVPLARRLKEDVDAYSQRYGEWPKSIVMQNHGLIAVGRSVRDVEAITYMFVKAARIVLGAYAAGGPSFLTQQNVDRIQNRPDEHYRQRRFGQRP